MKIRIKGNTVRYRLSKKEVSELAESGIVEEKTEFVNGSFGYAVKTSEQAEVSADLSQNIITLYVPETLIRQWAGTDQVGLAGEMSLKDGKTLSLLLEKDFKCIDLAVHEDQSGFFENPLLTC